MTDHTIPGQLSEADILAYIRLSRTEKLGPVTFRRLMNLYGEPHAALSALPELAARLAGEYGREVMAPPGSPLDPRCHGSNHLIRTGAALIELVDDIMEAVRPLIEN